jgi:hypothetical protein
MVEIPPGKAALMGRPNKSGDDGFICANAGAGGENRTRDIQLGKLTFYL